MKLKLSLPALLDAGRRFTAGLAMPRTRRPAFTRQQLRLARRGFLLLGLTLAMFIALHPPAARAQDRPDAAPGHPRMAVLLGLDGIGNSPAASPLPAGDIITGYRQLIAHAHAEGIAIFGATLTPSEGAADYSADKELVRETVNNWIRASDGFDGVIDFDRVVRDPAHPARLLPAYDSGDHLHPNDAAYRAMGTAVPLALFRAIGTDDLNAPAPRQ